MKDNIERKTVFKIIQKNHASTEINDERMKYIKNLVKASTDKYSADEAIERLKNAITTEIECSLAVQAAIDYDNPELLGLLIPSITDKSQIIETVIRNNRLDLIHAIVSAGINVNIYNGLMLSSAIRHQRMNIINYLLLNKANINTKPKNKEKSIVVLALETKDKEIIDKILSNADINIVTFKDILPSIIQLDDVSLLKYSLKKSGVNMCRVYDDVLLCAVKYGANTVLEHVGEYISKLKKSHRHNFNVQTVAKIGSGESVMILMKYGADFSFDNNAALTEAINANNTDVIKILLARKFYTNRQLQKIINNAYITQNEDLLKYIKSNEFDHSFDYKKLILWAVMQKRTKTLQSLADRGIELNNPDIDSLTVCVKYNLREMLPWLIEHGVEPKQYPYAIYWACINSDNYLIKTLIDNGADISYNDYEIVKRIIRDKNYNTFKYLHSLCKFNNDTLEMLKDYSNENCESRLLKNYIKSLIK